MIDEILAEAHMRNERDEKLPYPTPTSGPALSKEDNATPENEGEKLAILINFKEIQ